MSKTGLSGKLIFNNSIDTFCCKIMSSTNLIKYIHNRKIEIPLFQREVDFDKVYSIIKYFKDNNNIFLHNEFKTVCLKIDNIWKHYLVDGQHRIEAIRR